MCTPGNLSQRTAHYGVEKLRLVNVQQKDIESERHKTNVWREKGKSLELWSLIQITHVLFKADSSKPRWDFSTIFAHKTQDEAAQD
jgi:hypothetical protein